MSKYVICQWCKQPFQGSEMNTAARCCAFCWNDHHGKPASSDSASSSMSTKT